MSAPAQEVSAPSLQPNARKQRPQKHSKPAASPDSEVAQVIESKPSRSSKPQKRTAAPVVPVESAPVPSAASSVPSAAPVPSEAAPAVHSETKPTQSRKPIPAKSSRPVEISNGTTLAAAATAADQPSAPNKQRRRRPEPATANQPSDQVSPSAVGAEQAADAASSPSVVPPTVSKQTAPARKAGKVPVPYNKAAHTLATSANSAVESNSATEVKPASTPAIAESAAPTVVGKTLNLSKNNSQPVKRVPIPARAAAAASASTADAPQTETADAKPTEPSSAQSVSQDPKRPVPASSRAPFTMADFLAESSSTEKQATGSVNSAPAKKLEPFKSSNPDALRALQSWKAESSDHPKSDFVTAIASAAGLDPALTSEQELLDNLAAIMIQQEERQQQQQQQQQHQHDQVQSQQHSQHHVPSQMQSTMPPSQPFSQPFANDSSSFAAQQSIMQRQQQLELQALQVQQQNELLAVSRALNAPSGRQPYSVMLQQQQAQQAEQKKQTEILHQQHVQQHQQQEMHQQQQQYQLQQQQRLNMQQVPNVSQSSFPQYQSHPPIQPPQPQWQAPQFMPVPASQPAQPGYPPSSQLVYPPPSQPLSQQWQAQAVSAFAAPAYPSFPPAYPQFPAYGAPPPQFGSSYDAQPYPVQNRSSNDGWSNFEYGAASADAYRSRSNNFAPNFAYSAVPFDAAFNNSAFGNPGGI